MSTSRLLSSAALVAVGPLLVSMACGGGAPDPKTAGGGGETATTSTAPTPVPVASATSGDDPDLEDSPTADVVCKHIEDVLKGKAGSLQTCISELGKKQTDDVNYYVCFTGCSMAATSGDAVEACKTKCSK